MSPPHHSHKPEWSSHNHDNTGCSQAQTDADSHCRQYHSSLYFKGNATQAVSMPKFRIPPTPASLFQFIPVSPRVTSLQGTSVREHLMLRQKYPPAPWQQSAYAHLRPRSPAIGHAYLALTIPPRQNDETAAGCGRGKWTRDGGAGHVIVVAVP